MPLKLKINTYYNRIELKRKSTLPSGIASISNSPKTKDINLQ